MASSGHSFNFFFGFPGSGGLPQVAPSSGSTTGASAATSPAVATNLGSVMRGNFIVPPLSADGTPTTSDFPDVSRLLGRTHLGQIPPLSADGTPTTLGSPDVSRLLSSLSGIISSAVSQQSRVGSSGNPLPPEAQPLAPDANSMLTNLAALLSEASQRTPRVSQSTGGDRADRDAGAPIPPPSSSPAPILLGSTGPEPPVPPRGLGSPPATGLLDADVSATSPGAEVSHAAEPRFRFDPGAIFSSSPDFATGFAQQFRNLQNAFPDAASFNLLSPPTGAAPQQAPGGPGGPALHVLLQPGGPLSPNAPTEALHEFFQRISEMHGSRRSPASSAQVDALLDTHACTIKGPCAGEEAESCCICLDDMLEGEQGVLMPCCSNHLHRPCVLKWISKESSTCPVCRQALPEVSPPTPAVGSSESGSDPSAQREAEKLSEQSVTELKRRCGERDLDSSRCVEKKDLVALLLQERQTSSRRAGMRGRFSPPASSSGVEFRVSASGVAPSPSAPVHTFMSRAERMTSGPDAAAAMAAMSQALSAAVEGFRSAASSSSVSSSSNVETAALANATLERANAALARANAAFDPPEQQEEQPSRRPPPSSSEEEERSKRRRID